MISIRRALPTLSRLAKRPDFILTPRVRQLIEAFEKSPKTTWDQLKDLPAHEFLHLCDFITEEDAWSEHVLSPRELPLFSFLSDYNQLKMVESPTQRQKDILAILDDSDGAKLWTEGIESLPPPDIRLNPHLSPTTT